MPKDTPYQQAEQKTGQALQSGATESPKRPDRFPRGARKPVSRSPHATRLTTSLVKPVRSVTGVPNAS